jgi:hypothetical protein
MSLIKISKERVSEREEKKEGVGKEAKRREIVLVIGTCLPKSESNNKRPSAYELLYVPFTKKISFTLIG